MNRRLFNAREDGAYLVLYAVLAVVFFIVAALVLDITALRQDRRTSRLAADAAATAGAAVMNSSAASTVQACTDAWGFFLGNRPDSGGSVSAPPCGSTFASACSSGMAARTATGTAGGFEVEITNPVPDGHSLMQAESPGGDRSQTIDTAHDGADPCSRLGVRIVRVRDLSLAGVAGLRSASTDIHSVARVTPTTPTGQAPALVVLDPTDCNALTTSNGGQLTATGVGQPGIIIVDSAGSGGNCAGGYVIDVDDDGTITAPGGVIRSWAGLVNPTKAYDGGDVPGQLSPAPTPASNQTGRAAVDARYGTPTTVGTPLYNLVQTYGAAQPGLIRFPNPLFGESCTVTTSSPSISLFNRYVDCDTLTIEQGAELTFAAAGTLVFRGGIQISGLGQGGCLAVNSTLCGANPPPRDSTVFIRGGGIVKGDHGQLGLERAFVYLGGGGLDLAGGTGQSALRWTAPLAGDFEDLALWTDTASVLRITGQQSEFELEGLVFAASTAELLLEPTNRSITATAQFVVRRLRVDGTGSGPGNPFGIVVGPDPTRAVQDTTRAVRLIR